MSEMMYKLRCPYDPGLRGSDEAVSVSQQISGVYEFCCPGKVSRAIGLEIHAELSRARSLSPKAPSFGFRYRFVRGPQGQFWAR